MRRIISLALAVLLVLSTCMIGVFTVTAADSSTAGAGNSGANGTTGTVGATITAIAGTTGTIGASGAGTVDASYEPSVVPDNARPIYTAEDFAAMSPAGVYYLANDITVSKTYTFSVLEGETDGFRGILYGNGKTITTSVPLFAKLNNATVRDLTIDGEIYLPDGSEIAPLASIMTGSSLYGITNKANVTAKQFVGGIVATMWNSNQFEFCFNYGEMNVRNSEVAGLAARYNDTSEDMISFRNCGNFGKIGTSLDPDNNLGPSNAGGFIGWVGGNSTPCSVILENCINKGDITSDARTGGFIGVSYAHKLIIRNCVNEGTITGEDYKPTSGNDEANRTGGFVGWSYNKNGNVLVMITDSINKGAINSVEIAGGFIGHVTSKSGSVVINNCENVAKITSTGSRGGGIIAVSDTGSKDMTFTFTNCTNSGAVNVAGYAGGMIGSTWNSNVVFKSCLNSGVITGTSAVGGMSAHVRGNRTLNAADKTLATATTGNTYVIADNCLNTATMTGTGNAGGIIGRVYDQKTVTITNCENTANINSSGDVSGILGGIANDAAYKLPDPADETKEIDGPFLPYEDLELTMTGCLNTGNIKGTNRPGGIFGASVGFKSVVLKDNVNTGNVESTGNYCGGLYGRLDPMKECLIENCLNTGNVTATNPAKPDNYGGGLVGFWCGYADTVAVIKNVKNTGNIKMNSNAAGLLSNCGGIKSLTISNVTNEGKVESIVKGSTGGIIAYVGAKTLSITNALNTGAISNVADTGLGGIVGEAGSSVSITLSYCENRGTVTNSANRFCAGILGTNTNGGAEVTIDHCLNAGVITGKRVGAIFGANDHKAKNITISNTVNDAQVNVYDYGGSFIGKAGVTATPDDANTGNVTFTNCTNNGDVVKAASGAYGGGLLGATGVDSIDKLTFTNCTNNGDIKGFTGDTGAMFGVAKTSEIVLTNCVNNGDITNVTGNMGGLAGKMNVACTITFTNCVNTGNLSSRDNAGGFFGSADTAGDADVTLSFTDCINTGNVTSEKEKVSGFVARAAGSVSFTRCINTGALKAAKETGGMVGYNASPKNSGVTNVFTSCLNTGNLENTSAYIIGGIAGNARISATVTNCVNTGDIKGGGGASAGIIGDCGDSKGGKAFVFESCVNLGNITVSGSNANNVGGIVGYANAWNKAGISVKNCLVVADITTAGTNVSSFVAYMNSGTNYSSIQNNIFIGKVNATGTNADLPTTILMGFRSSTELGGTTDVANNYYFLNEGSASFTGLHYSQGDAKKNIPPRGYVAFEDGQNHLMTSATEDVTAKTGMNGFTYVAADKAIAIPGTTKTLSGNVPTAIVTLFSGNTLPKAPAASTPSTTASVATGATVTVTVDNTGSADAVRGGEIDTEEEFLAMLPGGNYVLTGDITLSTSYALPFNGTLDGNGHTITVTNAPVFNYLSGTVKNLTIDGSISLPETVSVGALAYKGVGFTLENVTNDADVEALAFAAGLVGLFFGKVTLTECVNNGAIVSGKWEAAGLIAKGVGCDTYMTDCVNNGVITANGGGTAGGLLGYIEQAHGFSSFIDCTNNGAIVAANPAGIVSNAAYGKVMYFENCVNNAAIGTREAVTTTAGGIMSNQGLNGAIIDLKDCANNGDVIGANQVGGLLGWTRGTNYINGCVNTATVISTGNYAGGIAGRTATNDDKINGKVLHDPMKVHVFTDCSNSGEVIAHRQNAGGILSMTMDSASFINCSNSGYIHGDVIDAPNGTTCKTNGCHDNGNTLHMVVGGMAGSVNFEGSFYYCTNTGKLVANRIVGGIAGQVGGGCTNANIIGPLGYNAFVACYNAGELYHNGLNSTSAVHAIGGLVGYTRNDALTKSLLVSYCGVAGTIKADINVNTIAKTVCGLVGYANNNFPVLENNYVVATFDVPTGTPVAVTYNAYQSAIDMSNLENNFVLADEATCYANALAGGTDIDEAQVVTKTEVTDGTLEAKLNAAIGTEAFSLSAITESISIPMIDPSKLTVSLVPEAITSAEDFLAMKPYGNYYLANDLELSTSYPYTFSGIFDGKDHTVTTSAPLFKTADGATFSNLTINGSIFVSVGSLGALANEAANVTVTNVTNNAALQNAANNTNHDYPIYFTAGILGEVEGNVTVTDSKNTATVAGNAPAGIVGGALNATLTLKDCVNVGMITSYSYGSNTGAGILSFATAGTFVLENCINNAPISFSNITKLTTRAGGIVGYINSTNATLTLKGCVNADTVVGGDQVGGILGWSKSPVEFTDCVNLANVISKNNYAGGIVARLDADATLTDCINYGDVFAHRQYAGGIGAYSVASAVFTRCLNTGYITSDNPYATGTCKDAGCHDNTNDRYLIAAGIVAAFNEARIYACVNTGDIKGNLVVGGIAGRINKRLTNDFEILYCVNLGDVISTGTRADQAWETSGGLFGFAKENADGAKITAMYNAVVCDVVVESGAGQCVGTIGSWMGKDSVMKYNYFSGTVTNGSKTTKVYALGQNVNAALTVDGNFFIDTLDAPYYNHKPSEATNVALTDNEKFAEAELTNGTLLGKLNTAAGENVFVSAPELNIPIHKDALAVLELADANLADFIPEDAVPVPTPDTDEGETTVPGDETTTEPEDTTVAPDDSTTEPDGDNTTAEPDGDVTTEPDGDVTTEPDGDSTTAGGSTTTEPGESEPTTDDKGCGSLIGASAAVIAIALVAPAAMLLKKKDEE